MSEHAKPLSPGEIRRYTVGARTFQVMHVAGGGMAQATYRDDTRTTVICTDRNIEAVVWSYAEAIEQAESDRADALDDADGVAFIGAATGELIEPGSQVDYNLPMGADPALVYGEPLRVDKAIAELQRFEEEDRAAVARGESANWWERGGEPQEKTAAELLAIIRDALRRYVPGGGEQYLDRYLAAVAGAVPQRATDAQCIGMPLPVGDAVPQCGHFAAAHYPHPIGESIRYRTWGA